MNSFPYGVFETELGASPVNDLRLLLPDETADQDWLELGPQPLMLILGSKRHQLRIVYQRGEAGPVTSVAICCPQSAPDRRGWSRARTPEFRSAAKNSPPQTQALWLRRGPAHPPVRRLAMIWGQWSDTTAQDWVELRSQWRLVQFDFSDTVDEFALLAFSTR